MVSDLDDDNDGVADLNGAFPLDSSEWSDDNNDGIGDNADNCTLVANSDQTNIDGDSEGNECDLERFGKVSRLVDYPTNTDFPNTDC